MRNERSASGTLDEERDGTQSGHHRSASRRTFLTAGAAVSAAAVAGCLGGGEAESAEGPEPPWTTEELAEQVDDGATINVYASTGADQEWYDLVDVINDEFGTSIEPSVFATNGNDLTQRFVQERQAGNDTADVLSSPTGIDDDMLVTAREESKEAALDIGRKYFEWDLDQKFWFNDVLEDVQQYPFYVTGYNGGPGLTMPINEDVFADRGLDVPSTYNDLLDDQYEGMEVAISSAYIASDMVGWIVRHNAAETELTETEWAQQLRDHLSYTGVSSHTAGTREVRDGNVPLMLYNWPTVIAPFTGEDSPLTGIFPEDVPAFMNGSPIAINKEAPNPWVARFFLSATLEESVQRRMINDVERQIPCRLDLDYSAQDPDPYTEKRLNSDYEAVEFWDEWRNSTVGQKVKDAGAFDI
ncbi:ABC transporter substrate-binding protein [Halorubrum sp. CBA1229]|jgi:ABC-type Fe3+ transport system substrate-binding protein|uniref:ABC transporter substrate-binding protein n=1 Tax=Halorubrum sp. CBA1229 TaxID=1853699 RepID=UPI000F4188AC|nr:ABC transporter substrate-binding protein [Halorubrum sp. CBA1229]QKY15494.1 ABC transporter substrate-binding protein [Halorubrum sp. CBA1229]